MGQQPADSARIDPLSRAKALYGQLTPESTLLARELLEKAVVDAAAADRGWLAESWALLADILTCDYLNRWNGAAAAELARAEQAADQALRIEPELPLAHYAYGFIFRAKGEHEAALAAFARTIELNPDFVRAYAQKANELMYLGRLDEVQPLVETAIRRTPPGSLALGMFYWIIGRAWFFAGRYAEAIAWLRQSVEVRPNLWYNRLYLVSAYALTGDAENAAKALQEFDETFPGYTLARVAQNERTNPNHRAVVVDGRRKLHQGLLEAGLQTG